jgi:cobyric acid synthase
MLMVQGTASSAGKSVLVSALCRIFRQDGLSVAPFKSQNMALNSFVTRDGGEIGRAQAEQAEAAGLEPSVLMNPVLLKPEADAVSQVVVMGSVAGRLSAMEYRAWSPRLLEVVKEALETLRSLYEVVVIEGAGSPAEVNLQADEIVNMRVARIYGTPVLLVGDIDRGGVFAALHGTLDLLGPGDRDLVKGLIINKFRGDINLLRAGLDFIEAKTGKPVLGVVPWLREVGVAQEDSVWLEHRRSEPTLLRRRGRACAMCARLLTSVSLTSWSCPAPRPPSRIWPGSGIAAWRVRSERFQRRVRPCWGSAAVTSCSAGKSATPAARNRSSGRLTGWASSTPLRSTGRSSVPRWSPPRCSGRQDHGPVLKGRG